MFQIYGTGVGGHVFAVPAGYIEWRGRVSAKAGGAQDKAKHLYGTGRHLADDPAAAAAAWDFGNRRGSIAGRGGRFVAEPVLSDRSKSGISRHTGGYSQARAEAADGIMQASAGRTDHAATRDPESVSWPPLRLSFWTVRRWNWKPAWRCAAFSVYRAENQHGQAHWPVLRIVAVHELETGLAEEPCWGAMYGNAAVSEQQLADQAMDSLNPGSILVGDRNFGVFSIAWQARQRGLEVVIRLTEQRARKLAGGPISGEGERMVRWTPSRFDGRRQGGMPEGAAVEGRLIALRIGKGPRQTVGSTCSLLSRFRRPRLWPCTESAGTSRPICAR